MAPEPPARCMSMKCAKENAVMMSAGRQGKRQVRLTTSDSCSRDAF